MLKALTRAYADGQASGASGWLPGASKPTSGLASSAPASSTFLRFLPFSVFGLVSAGAGSGLNRSRSRLGRSRGGFSGRRCGLDRRGLDRGRGGLDRGGGGLARDDADDVSDQAGAGTALVEAVVARGPVGVGVAAENGVAGCGEARARGDPARGSTRCCRGSWRWRRCRCRPGRPSFGDALVKPDAQHRQPLRCGRLVSQPHACFFRCAPAFLAIAVPASDRDVVPSSGAAARSRQDVIDGRIAPVQLIAAVLAAEIVSCKQIGLVSAADDGARSLRSSTA